MNEQQTNAITNVVTLLRQRGAHHVQKAKRLKLYATIYITVMSISLLAFLWAGVYFFLLH